MSNRKNILNNLSLLACPPLLRWSPLFANYYARFFIIINVITARLNYVIYNAMKNTMWEWISTKIIIISAKRQTLGILYERGLVVVTRWLGLKWKYANGVSYEVSDPSDYWPSIRSKEFPNIILTQSWRWFWRSNCPVITVAFHHLVKDYQPWL